MLQQGGGGCVPANLYLVALVAAVALVAVAPVDLGLECSYLKCGLVCGVEV